MTRQDERLDPEQIKARDRVLAWFKVSRRRNPDPVSQPTGTVAYADNDPTRIVGTIVCMIYALVWLMGWTSDSWWAGSASFFDINDQRPIPDVLGRPPAYVKFVPVGFAGLFIFLTAPFMRTQ